MKKKADVVIRSKRVGESELHVTIKVPPGQQMKVFVEVPEEVQLFQSVPKAPGESARKKILLSPVSELQLSTRAKGILRTARLYLVGEVVLRNRKADSYDPSYIGGGKKTLDEIEAELQKHGLHFAMPLSRDLRNAILRERTAIEKEIEAKHARELREKERNKESR